MRYQPGLYGHPVTATGPTFAAAGAVVTTTLGTTLSPVAPAGAYGLLFAHVQVGGGDAMPEISTPPGWDLLNDAQANSGNAFSRLVVFGRASPPTVSITFDYGGASGRAQAVILGYDNVNSAAPVESAATAQDVDNGLTTAAVPLTAVTVPSIAIQAYGGRAIGTSAITATPGAGYVERVDSGPGETFQFFTLVINDQVLAAAGAVGAATETWSGTVQCIAKSGFILK